MANAELPGFLAGWPAHARQLGLQPQALAA
jgi:hypothetical protein